MAFELKIQAKSLNQDGTQLTIEDISDWTQDPNNRADYGVILQGYQIKEVNTPLSILPANPISVEEWVASVTENGRYQFTAYRFFELNSPNAQAPITGEVRWDTLENTLKQYNGVTWDVISIEDGVSYPESTSEILDLPLLQFAYEYKNLLNLKYITVFKNDIANGVVQNKLYYKRQNLDYFVSLIQGAEYNWALNLFNQYQDIVDNINTIIKTGKIV